jgi:hypothetical protein
MALKKPATFEQEPTNTNAANDAAAAAGAVDTGAAAVNAAASAPTAAVQSPVKVMEASAPAANDEPAASGTAVVVKPNGALITADEAAAKAKAFQSEFNAMRGASDFGWGNYRVFKGSNGSLLEMNGDKEDLGRWAKVRLISWNDHFEISPGEQSASTKDFVGYSADGKTLDSLIGDEQKVWIGKPVGEYLQYLREKEGFDSAKARRFIDLGVALLACDTGDGPLNSVIQVTLSESSIPSFSRYQGELNDTARCVAMGIPGFKLADDPFTFHIIREVTSAKGNTWTKLNIKGALPAKI